MNQILQYRYCLLFFSGSLSYIKESQWIIPCNSGIDEHLESSANMTTVFEDICFIVRIKVNSFGMSIHAL